MRKFASNKHARSKKYMLSSGVNSKRNKERRKGASKTARLLERPMGWTLETRTFGGGLMEAFGISLTGTLAGHMQIEGKGVCSMAEDTKIGGTGDALTRRDFCAVKRFVQVGDMNIL